MAKPKAARCPTCGRVASWEDNAHRPFCCERCKLADLGNWALERYRIPGPPVDLEPSSDDDEPEN